MASPGRRRLLKALPIDIEQLYEKVDEPLPHSAKRWWWCVGGLVGLLFLLQVVTGLLLAFYYRAGPDGAYQTVAYISENARYGLFIRSVHNWGATFMIVFLFLHMLRVFVTGAYRDYRWGAWMVGVGLMAVTLGMGFTGYALVSDQLSYWAVTVTSNIIAAVPILGSTFKNLFLAGNTINESTGSRMYALHVQVLPATLIALSIAHLFFIRLMGLYKPGNARDRDLEQKAVAARGPYHFYPDHVATEMAVFLYLVVLIFLLALAMPASLGSPADPGVTPEHIKPEWYFYPSFHLLKMVPGTAGVLLMGLAGLTLLLWPILDHYLFRRVDTTFKGRAELSLILGLIIVAISLIWSLAEAGH